MFSQVYENSQFSLLAMELGRTQRLKTLEHVSVHGLEEALEKGFTIAACLHYHDFISFISLSLKKKYIYILTGRAPWPRPPDQHLQQDGLEDSCFFPHFCLRGFVSNLVRATFRLQQWQNSRPYVAKGAHEFLVNFSCSKYMFLSNYRSVISMSLQALMACHAKKPFTLGSLSFEQMISFFNSKLRMLAAKLRGLLNPTSWQQLQKKLDCAQRDCFEKMLRCLCPNFSCDGNKPFPANDSQEFPAFPTGGAALPFLDDLQLYFQLPFCVFLCLLGQIFTNLCFNIRCLRTHNNLWNHAWRKPRARTVVDWITLSQIMVLLNKF